MPLVWLVRRHGHPLKRRVYGPELMQTFCSATEAMYRHFVFGGTLWEAASFGQALNEKYKINVVEDEIPRYDRLQLWEGHCHGGSI
jgi:UDP-N-acetyl-D-mannosaminuronic acid transferase (WecB/TagA/CpsF family)